MMRTVIAMLFTALLALQGCTYYGVPATTTVPASFDRSFDAAAGALLDQGVAITIQDRASGTIAGNAGGTGIRASVLRQADGSVRVQFDSSDSRDPDLLQRISRSYDRRMGR